MKRIFLSVSSKSLSFLMIVILFFCSGSSLQDDGNENKDQTSGITSWGYQLQNADPGYISQSGFDLIVIDYSLTGTEEGEYSATQISGIKDSGKYPIAYLSIGEAEDYRFYWKKEWENNPPEWLGKENPQWEGNYKVKFWNQEWKSIIYSYLDKIIAQKFSGVYLDIVDAFEYWSDEEIIKDENLTEQDAAERMILFIKEIAEYCRAKSGSDFMVIPQNGERIVDYDKNGYYTEAVSGIGIEDLFYNETDPVDNNEIVSRTSYIDRIKSAGKIVFSVDYVDSGTGYSGNNKARIDDYYSKCRNRGYIPYAAISDRELNELNIINGIQPH